MIQIYDESAEKTVLGTILVYSTLLPTAQQLLKPEHFFTDYHRNIYAAMLILAKQDREITPLSIHAGLKQQHLETPIAYLMDLIDFAYPGGTGMATHAEIVRTKAEARQIHFATSKAAAQCISGESPDNILADLQADLVPCRQEAAKSFPQACQSVLEEIYCDAPPAKLSWGVHKLDLMTTGIRDGYSIIAGRSGQGKSALVRQAAKANVIAGHKVKLFTPEMTSEQFISLLLPEETSIPYWKFRYKKLNASEKRVCMEVMDRISQWPLDVDDKSGIEIHELIAKAKTAIGQGCELVLVDYLQLVKAKGDSERERINTISGELRDLAKRTGVPVVALSQLSRPEAKNQNERPTIYHLKESGNLETDAFNVFLLFRPIDKQSGEFTGQDEIIIGKQRFGEANIFAPVSFDKNFLKYGDRM